MVGDPIARLRADVETEGVGVVHLLTSEAREILAAYDTLATAARAYAAAQDAFGACLSGYHPRQKVGKRRHLCACRRGASRPGGVRMTHASRDGGPQPTTTTRSPTAGVPAAVGRTGRPAGHTLRTATALGFGRLAAEAGASTTDAARGISDARGRHGLRLLAWASFARTAADTTTIPVVTSLTGSVAIAGKGLSSDKRPNRRRQRQTETKCSLRGRWVRRSARPLPGQPEYWSARWSASRLEPQSSQRRGANREPSPCTEFCPRGTAFDRITCVMDGIPFSRLGPGCYFGGSCA